MENLTAFELGFIRSLYMRSKVNRRTFVVKSHLRKCQRDIMDSLVRKGFYKLDISLANQVRMYEKDTYVYWLTINCLEYINRHHPSFWIDCR